jgi:hypothetical protein
MKGSCVGYFARHMIVTESFRIAVVSSKSMCFVSESTDALGLVKGVVAD